MTVRRQALQKADLIQKVADIVSAYVVKNPVQPSALPQLISSVHASMVALDSSDPVRRETAVPAKGSVRQDYVVCLECGRKFRSLRRHLGTIHGLTPHGYRAKWQLPQSSPMIAPEFAAARSMLAKQIGLGGKRLA